MSVIEDWRAEANRMRDEDGMSERAIAAALGKAPSTVHEALVSGYEPPAAEPTPGQQTIDGDEVPATQNGHVRHDPALYVEQIRVDGTTQVAIDFGGKQAQTCKVSLRGSAEVDGFFRKGDPIRGTFEAVIDGAGAKDKVDKQTGIVTEAVQSHSAKITDMVTASDRRALIESLFRQYVASNRQAAAALADDLVRISGE